MPVNVIASKHRIAGRYGNLDADYCNTDHVRLAGAVGVKAFSFD